VTPAEDRATLRVAHVIHSLGAGGAEAVLATLAGAARRVGVETVVIGLSDADDDRAVPALHAAGAQVHQLHRARHDPRAVLDVVRLLRRERVDVVHTHLKHADVVGGVAARALALPAVSTLHLIAGRADGWAARARLRLAMEARARCFRTVVALSEAQRAWYRQQGGAGPVALVPNGVEEPLPGRPRPAVRRALGVADGEVLALTVSLLRPEKGHRTLLDAVRLLPPDLPVRFALAGDGELLDELAATVGQDERLASRVRLLGFRPDVTDLLQAADLVVHPSAEDALPTALIQALAAGRAVLATAVGGIPDIVGADAGRLVPAGDPDALAAGLTALVGDPDLRARSGRAGRRRYETTFSADVWVHRLREVYDQARTGTATPQG
jgi:glycosyltransferase involved in cell wall biosynthesis